MKMKILRQVMALILINSCSVIFADILNFQSMDSDTLLPPLAYQIAANEKKPSNITTPQQDLTTVPKTEITTEDETTNPMPLSSKTFTFKELNWLDLRLQGSKANLSFYLAVPKQIKYLGARVHLLLTQSPILRENSSITFLLNNNRLLSSLALKPGNNGVVSWDINFPKAELNSDWISLGFIAHWDAEHCKDYDDPANWVFISPDSTITIDYQKLDLVPDLASLPYPFNATNFLDKAENVVVLPSSLSIKTIIPALYVARKMGIDANYNPVNLKVVSNNELTEKQKENDNLILIGTRQEMPMINPLIDNLKTKAAEVINANTGIIGIFALPTNPFHALLAITGQTEQAVVKAAMAFAQPDFTKIFYGQLAFIVDEPAAFQPSTTEKGPFSLKSLGYNDQTIIGLGQGNLSYNFNLPIDKIADELIINTIFSHSAFTPKDHSILTVAVNGVKQGSILLGPENGENARWPITVKGEVLNPGPNTLSYTFDLHVPKEDCSTRYDFQTWGVIQAQTALEANFATNDPLVVLNRFPRSFNQNTLVVLPEPLDVKAATAIVNLFAKFGSLFGNDSFLFKVKAVSEVDEDALKQHNLILIGSLSNNPLIKNAISKAPIRIEQGKMVFYNEGNKQRFMNNAEMGFAELMPSPWNNDLTTLIISGTNEEQVSSAINMFIQQDSFFKMIGNVALTMQDGSVLSFETRPKPVMSSLIKELGQGNIVEKITDKAYLKALLQSAYNNLGLVLMTFFLVIVLLLALIGFFIRRKRE